MKNKQTMSQTWKYIFGFLALIAVVSGIAVLSYPDEKNLRLIACDVGQGDAILAIQGTTQILIDGGPDSSVMECLSKYMPFWDREVDVIILTHPQKDHYGGLIDVFEAYSVGYLIATPVGNSTSGYQVLKDLVGGKGVEVINPLYGQKMKYGLIYLDILNPLKEAYLASEFSNPTDATRSTPSGQAVSESDKGVLGVYTTSKDLNDFSVVTLLSFGDFDALLTGDISPEISDKIAEELMVGESRSIEYLKVPHHGSKNGLSQKLLDAVNPTIAVISSGKNNSYGHPHKEILDMLESIGTRILRTDLEGDIEVSTDGETWQAKD